MNMGRKKTAAQKAPRSKWHEHTAEKDIRYRGPLNYQHFQILGWLCIVVSQVGLILSISGRISETASSAQGMFANSPVLRTMPCSILRRS